MPAHADVPAGLRHPETFQLPLAGTCTNRDLEGAPVSFTCSTERNYLP
jgi:hypothetical protein